MKPEEPKEEPKTAPEEKTKEESPPQPTPPAPAAPETERTASVQIPLSLLAELPQQMTRANVEKAVEALRQGTPMKDALELIGG